jgi:hypothetical protein
MAINAQATQSFVPIKEVQGGIVVLKDDSVRAVLLASSINLALKSYDEQKAVLAQFQTFLNSLDFTVQIVVQSRKYDIRPYILELETRANEQIEPLLKIQTREYMNFITSLTEQINIMKKSFFVVIPYTGSVLPTSSKGFGSMFGGGDKKTQAANNQMDFEEKRSQLEQRIGVVQQGLARIGVKTAQLGTEEVIELFYKIFNPGDTEKPIQTQ